MKLEFEFYPISIKPDYNKPLLIRYSKGKKGQWNGQKGTFLTQGYFSEGWNGVTTACWFDYTDRLLRAENSTTSKNEIIEWAYIN